MYEQKEVTRKFGEINRQLDEAQGQKSVASKPALTMSNDAPPVSFYEAHPIAVYLSIAIFDFFIAILLWYAALHLGTGMTKGLDEIAIAPAAAAVIFRFGALTVFFSTVVYGFILVFLCMPVNDLFHNPMLLTSMIGDQIIYLLLSLILLFASKWLGRGMCKGLE